MSQDGLVSLLSVVDIDRLLVIALLFRREKRGLRAHSDLSSSVNKAHCYVFNILQKSHILISDNVFCISH